mgnify:CR=1 FL=1
MVKWVQSERWLNWEYLRRMEPMLCQYSWCSRRLHPCIHCCSTGQCGYHHGAFKARSRCQCAYESPVSVAAQMSEAGAIRALAEHGANVKMLLILMDKLLCSSLLTGAMWVPSPHLCSTEQMSTLQMKMNVLLCLSLLNREMWVPLQHSRSMEPMSMLLMRMAILQCSSLLIKVMWV